jgi:predicted dienelactone hydrolase
MLTLPKSTVLLRKTIPLVLVALTLAGCVVSTPLSVRDPAAAAYVAGVLESATRDLTPEASRFVTEIFDWRDNTRDRAVPVRIYRPADASGALPLVVFSHGIGGSREGYRYLGRHFASNGFIAVHIQHVGSDRALWMGNPLGLLGRLSGAATESEALARVADVRFVLDRVLDADFPHRIDAARIVVAGHSYGANTAMLATGARVEKEGRRVAFGDARIRAAILISAPPFYGMKDTRAILENVAVPTLHVTATDDDIMIPGFRSGLDDRIDVFDAMGAASRAPKWLAVFKGGAHSMFTDRLAPGGTDLNPVVKTATRDLALQFARRVLQVPARDAAGIANWRDRHAPLIARFEQLGGLPD